MQKVEFVLMVALIAVAKTVILLDYAADPIKIFSLAALVLALAVGYYLLRRTSPGKD